MLKPFLFTAAVTATAAVAFAQPPSATRIKAHLSLSDSQMQNFRAIREQQRGATESAAMDLRSKERALRDQLAAGNTDAASLGRLVLDIEAARKRIDAARQSSREQALSSLTPEQKTRLKALEEARKLAPAIHEAEMLGLLDPPVDAAPDASGRPARFGTARRGPGGPPPPRPRADQ